jgi:acyl-CoA synthetase (NDP forming)
MVAAQPEYDLLLLLPTHHAPGMEHDIADRLSEVIKQSGKAVACCVIGNSDFANRIHTEFMSKGIPSFPTPERAVRALAVVPEYAVVKKAARETGTSPGRQRRFARKTGPLRQDEVSMLLHAYGIEEPKSVVVEHAKDLQKLEKFDFPVACKLLSPGALHKTELGGVALNVRDVGEAERAFERFQRLAAKEGAEFDGMLVQEMVKDGVELLLGGTRDPTFGPVVVLGLGGTYTELLREYRLAVSPISEKKAKRMLVGDPLAKVLHGYRGGPRVNVGRLCEVVSAFSRIMVDNPSIEQVEVNPMIATRSKILAVDVRMILRTRRD